MDGVFSLGGGLTAIYSVGCFWEFSEFVWVWCLCGCFVFFGGGESFYNVAIPSSFLGMLCCLPRQRFCLVSQAKPGVEVLVQKKVRALREAKEQNETKIIIFVFQLAISTNLSSFVFPRRKIDAHDSLRTKPRRSRLV